MNKLSKNFFNWSSWEPQINKCFSFLYLDNDVECVVHFRRLWPFIMFSFRNLSLSLSLSVSRTLSLSLFLSLFHVFISQESLTNNKQKIIESHKSCLPSEAFDLLQGDSWAKCGFSPISMIMHPLTVMSQNDLFFLSNTMADSLTSPVLPCAQWGTWWNLVYHSTISLFTSRNGNWP